MKEKYFIDTETGKTVFISELQAEYNNNDEIKECFPYFNLWLMEITGKNGTLTEIKT